MTDTPAPDGGDGDGDEAPAGSRTATLRTRHEAPETVARAVSPDNTAEMTTTVADGHVETTVVRDGTGGLRATATDYLANLRVATTVRAHARQHATAAAAGRPDGRGDSGTDTETETDSDTDTDTTQTHQ